MSKATIATEAQKRLRHPGIAKLISELGEEAAERNSVTVDSLLAEFEEARQLAKIEGQISAMVSASMGKAKITGLDKKVIEIQESAELTPWDSLEADEA